MDRIKACNDIVVRVGFIIQFLFVQFWHWVP